MALPLGKLTVLIGAGLVRSVLAKDGSLPDVSSFVSGAFKIVFKQLKQEEPSKSRNDTALVAQVNSLWNELQLLASTRPITIVTTQGSGRKYGVIIIIGVIGYGYVWWKDTKREIGSEIDRMDCTLDASSVTELRDETANVKDDVRSVFEAVETLRRILLTLRALYDREDYDVRGRRIRRSKRELVEENFGGGKIAELLRRREAERQDFEETVFGQLQLGLGTDRISGFLKVFVICFVCYGYLIFRFALLRKNTDILKNGYPENN
ncbi:hypothetical protein N665_1075s0003 [Sinapis alba]|nr:hypothetical protein N665_1075s0003 [Sinapis alba]